MKKPRRGQAKRLARITGFAVQAGKSPPRKSLWLLDTADKVLRELGKAIWLSLASLWRVPRALIARNSIERLKSLEKNGKVLPARINLLVASFVLSLLLLSDVPEWMEWTATLIPHDGIKGVLSVSPENMLGIAAPALLSIWATSNLLGRVLARIARVDVETPISLMMQALSSVCMLVSIGSFGLKAAFIHPYLRNWHVPDVIIILGLILLPMYLIASGGSWARQVCPPGECSPARYKVLMSVSIFSFLASFATALSGTSRLAQLEIRAFAALEGMVINTDSPANMPDATASGCFINNDALICQFLLSIRSSPDVAIGALQEVNLSWYEQSTMKSRRIPILLHDSQIMQLAPPGNPDRFTILRVREPVPFSFRIVKTAACQLIEELLITPEYKRFSPTVRLSFDWGPGFWLFAKAKSGFQETHISLPLFRNQAELFEFHHFCADRPK